MPCSSAIDTPNFHEKDTTQWFGPEGTQFLSLIAQQAPVNPREHRTSGYLAILNQVVKDGTMRKCAVSKIL